VVRPQCVDGNDYLVQRPQCGTQTWCRHFRATGRDRSFLCGDALPENEHGMGRPSQRPHRSVEICAPEPELYDLTRDPGGTTNVIQQHPTEIERFEVLLNGVVSSAGHGTTEKVETRLVDARVMEELKSLGYLSGISPRGPMI
jgi:hypothetical protein